MEWGICVYNQRLCCGAHAEFGKIIGCRIGVYDHWIGRACGRSTAAAESFSLGAGKIYVTYCFRRRIADIHTSITC